MSRNSFIERSLQGAFSFLRESIFSEEYAAKAGFLQARDPRLKSLSVLFLLLAVLLARNVSFLIAMYAFCLFLAHLSSINLGFFLRRTWVFIPLFSLVIVLPVLFDIFTPGDPLISLRFFGFSLSVTRQGISSAVFFFMRVLTSVSLCILLVLTTRHHVLLKVLRTFGVPQVFVMTAGICYRYIYLFIEIIQNTYLAIKSRVGFVSSLKKGQGIVAWNIAVLWQRSYRMNEEVYKAMLSRGYCGEPEVLNEFSAGPKDRFWLAAAMLIFASVFYPH